MLCDEILADPKLPRLYPGFDKFQDKLRAAHKFVLAPDFTAAADGLVENMDELKRITPFCRLPFPVCWFELAQGDRPHFLDGRLDYPALQGRPKRIGFLTYAKQDDQLWTWNTILMWSLHGPFPSYALSSPNNVSVMAVAFDTKNGFGESIGLLFKQRLELTNNINPNLAPFAPPGAETIMKPGDPMMKVAMSDWAGETRYLLAVLGLLNARNVMEQEKVDKTEHNRKRAKHRQPPLCSHTVLKIRAMHRRSFLGQRGSGTSEDVRKHFVIGHWKARKTGLFWWNPHWRGTGTGVVTHDYEVRT